MGLRFDEICIDAARRHGAGRRGGRRCWAGRTDVDEDGDVVLHAPPAPGRTGCSWRCPTTRSSRTASTSTSRPDDQRAEVERVVALGARHVDIGQGEQSWVVLADPEGNEFCILAAEN